jgi:hypothetical protein
MEKLDLTKQFKKYYSAKPYPEVLEFDEVQYISIEGKGDPSGKSYLERIQSLYPVAYSIKFACKAIEKDFVVPKLEGQWWFDDQIYKNITIESAPTEVPRSEWQWRLLIRMPQFVTEDIVEDAKELVLKKKPNTFVEDVKFFRLNEGLVIQILHSGPFSDEPLTLKEIDKFSKENGFEKAGLHHEIYLTDYNRTSPDKLKTILREPVRKK